MSLGALSYTKLTKLVFNIPTEGTEYRAIS